MVLPSNQVQLPNRATRQGKRGGVKLGGTKERKAILLPPTAEFYIPHEGSSDVRSAYTDKKQENEWSSPLILKIRITQLTPVQLPSSSVEVVIPLTPSRACGPRPRVRGRGERRLKLKQWLRTQIEIGSGK
jgi:hypothetical protein